MTPDPRLVASPTLSHIRNVEAPCGRRPEVGFNTCSETSELSASRRYSCLFCTHITSFSHIRNVETPCGRRPEVGFNTCSEMSRQAACRRYSCPHITSFSHIGNVETPCGRRPEAGFNTCSETSELSACCRYSCLFCTHITSFSHIRNVETPCGRRPEAGFNTCSETSELSACRRYSCLILQSHHLASSHMSASLAPKRVTETVFDNTSIRTTGLALQPENDAVTKLAIRNVSARFHRQPDET